MLRRGGIHDKNSDIFHLLRSWRRLYETAMEENKEFGFFLVKLEMLLKTPKWRCQEGS